MKYEKIRKGIFISRPNRFIAEVSVDDRIERCHVKNTGRCREILVPGAEVWLEEGSNPNRKTKYSLVTVKKNDFLINIDSQAPNKIVDEWLREGNCFKNLTLLKPEYKAYSSRFDFYAEADNKKHLIEVKGCTLENNGILSFPDAPTERGTRHVRELIKAKSDGYECRLIFVIQMEKADAMTINKENDPKLYEAVKDALAAGVAVDTLTCTVTPDTVTVLSDNNIFSI